MTPPTTVRALVLEDNPGDAEVTRLSLEGHPRVRFEVSCVGNMQEAGEWFEQFGCDVALIDLNLPDSLGLATLTQLRRFAPNTPVIIVSGVVNEQLRSEALALEVEAVISKDLRGSSLFAPTILSVVQHRQALSQKRQLEKLLGSTPDAVLVVDREGVVLYCNQQALVFFERSHDELFAERLHFAVTEGAPIELRVSRRSGEKLGELRVVDLEWDGRPAALATVRDITQQRNLEMQLLMADRLVSLGTLAAGVAHEINNPLAALLANVGLAVESLQAPEPSLGPRELRECLGDARDAAERIRQVVRDLKTLSRAEEDQREPHDVHGILDSVARMAWIEIHHSARLVKDYGAVPPVVVSESRLSQVFLNLLINAGQAIGAGHAESNEVRISTRLTQEGMVAIEIRDTGPGIPPEVQRRLFTPFFTTKPVGKGTGLGLSICQRIITALGGQISFESKVGVGTCFRVLLPAAAPLTVRPPRRPAPAAPALPRRRILVIDDDPLILSSLGRALGLEHEVLCFDRAPQALARLRQGERFDLILCDLMMPEMTGMELGQILENELPEVMERVVFITGGAFTTEARAFLDRVPNLRLEKPFDMQVLRQAIGGPLQ